MQLLKRNLLIVFVVAAAAIAVSMYPLTAQSTETSVQPAETPVVEHVVTSESINYTDIYNRVSPSVVAINVLVEQEQVNPFIQRGAPSAGSGSGFVIDTDGHIVTNNHVVENADRIEVSFFDGTLARGEVVGLDPNSDLAVIKVDLPAEELHPVTFADSDIIQVGERVLAIGSPFGQRWTLTEGIVSALQRTIQGGTSFSIGGVIQTDASINPGNSGGPLLNAAGEVIGVNSQILSRSGSSAGVGFAIPSNLTQRVARDLIEKGYVEYSYIGISGGDVSLALIEALELPNDTRGVVVSDVADGGPAARAGIRAADDLTDIDGLRVPQKVDIITAINGQPLTGIADLITYLANETKPGDTVTLDVLRDGDQRISIEVRLTPRQA